MGKSDVITADGYAVVVITRDRPSYLEQFIKALELAIGANKRTRCLGVTVIDDSLDKRSRLCNVRSVKQYLKNAPTIYIDRGEQEKLIIKAYNLKIKGFLRPLGASSWCVGGVRNTGALYWLMHKPSPKVITFFDDDLLPVKNNHEWLDCLVNRCVCSMKIMGGRIVGMRDESRLDRMRRGLLSDKDRSNDIAVDDRHNAYPISGGFMAVPSHLMKRNCFSLIYNEDWIFCLEQTADGATTQHLPEIVLHQRNSRDTPSIARLEQESLGELAYRTMAKISPELRLLENLAEYNDLWVEEQARYCREILDVSLLGAQSLRFQSKYRNVDLQTLQAWVAQLVPTHNSFIEHGLARVAWRRKFIDPNMFY